MQDITTLFTAIGDFFTKADWLPMVKWPFWILLGTVAFGGVYCARFGKKTLLNQGISSVLNLLVIYLTATICYIHFPTLRSVGTELPFLSATDQAVALVDPANLRYDVLAPILLRMMLLTLLVNLAESFSTGGKTLFAWFWTQIATVVIGLVFYTVVTAGLSLILPGILNRFAIIPVVLIIITGIVVFCSKFIFTVVIQDKQHRFNTVYKFFTVNKAGSLFTTSALSFLLIMIILFAMQMTGASSLDYSTVNITGMWIILAMLLLVLYIFNMFYHDKKKA